MRLHVVLPRCAGFDCSIARDFGPVLSDRASVQNALPIQPPETLPAAAGFRSRHVVNVVPLISTGSRLKQFRQQSFAQINGYCVDSNRFLIAPLQQCANSAPFLMPFPLHLYATADCGVRRPPVTIPLALSGFPVVILFLTMLDARRHQESVGLFLTLSLRAKP